MAQPEWISPAGSLGTIPEEVFFQYTMLATTPVVATVSCTSTDSVTNRITCETTADIWPGLNVIFGVNDNIVLGGLSPLIRYFVLEVFNSTQFSVAATEFSTTPISLTTSTGVMSAEFRQHVLFNLQAGQLPSGIQVADNGLIIGTPKAVASIQGVPTPVSRDVTSKFTVRAYTKKYVDGLYLLDAIRDRTFTLTVTGPNPPEFITPSGQIAQYYDTTSVSYQIQTYDQDPGQTPTIKLVSGSLPPGLTISSSGLISGVILPSVSRNYTFTLEVTDGVFSQLRTFSIYVYSKAAMTAGNDGHIDPLNPATWIRPFADNTFVTADVTPASLPIIINTPGNIGSVKNDNWFAYQFVGEDLDGSNLTYTYIVDSGSTSIPGVTLDPNSGWLYGYIPNFGYTQRTYYFTIRVSKTSDPTIYSEANYNLIVSGPVDTAVTWITPSNLGTITNGDTSTFYVEATNTANVVLQYELLSGSNSNLPQGLQLLPSGHIAGRVSFNTFAVDLGTTTFDVTMNDLGISTINSETTFDLKNFFVVRAFDTAGLIDINKTFSITVNRLYDEPYDNLYIEAMPPEDDRALIQNLLQNSDIFQPSLLYRPDDPNFGRVQKIVYQHAYGLTSTTYADYVSSLYKNHYWKNLTLGEIKVAQARNSAGEVIYEVVYSQVIDNLVNDQGQSVSKSVTLPYAVDDVKTVYPNSLINMRDQVIDTVGKVGDVLPLWMKSKQSNGRVLGFTPAAVLAYVKPGKGDQLAYYIRTQFGEKLNLVDFDVDRYEIDRLLSKNWDPIADSSNAAWISVTTNPPAVSLPAETYFDLFATTDDVPPTWVNSSGNAVSWINNSAQVVNWTSDYVYQGQTTFDGNSLKFIAPVDMYTQTQAYDKYLVFPHKTILG